MEGKRHSETVEEVGWDSGLLLHGQGGRTEWSAWLRGLPLDRWPSLQVGSHSEAGQPWQGEGQGRMGRKEEQLPFLWAHGELGTQAFPSGAPTGG